MGVEGKRLIHAVELLGKLVSAEPVECVEGTYPKAIYMCRYCDREWTGWVPKDWRDERQHARGCPWRLAMEYLKCK